jgi:hypothetical protein
VLKHGPNAACGVNRAAATRTAIVRQERKIGGLRATGGQSLAGVPRGHGQAALPRRAAHLAVCPSLKGSHPVAQGKRQRRPGSSKRTKVRPP